MNKAVAQLFLHIKLPPISVTEKRAMDFILLMDLGGQEFRQGIAGGRVSIPGWLSFSWKPQMEGLRGRMVGGGGAILGEVGMESSGGSISVTWAGMTPRSGLGRTAGWTIHPGPFHMAWASSQYGGWILRGSILMASIPNRTRNTICRVQCKMKTWRPSLKN